MTAERYELRADHTDWLDVRDPQGYRNTINQPGAVVLIRQQARDLDQLRADLAAAVAERNALTDVLYRSGFTKCDIPACNCGSWHHRYGLPERMREIKDELSDADHPCGNSNGWLPINALRQLIAEHNQLRARLAAIDAAPTVALVEGGDGFRYLSWGQLPPVDTQLIARPAKD